MRILADIPDADIKWLDARAAELGKSRAALLREAVSAYREAERDWLEQGFGLWTRYGRGVDGASFENAVRASWGRDDAEPISAAEAPSALEEAPDGGATPADNLAEPEPDAPVEPEPEAEAPDEDEGGGYLSRRGWFR